jgi:predicted RNase H-like HicB family nuclease
MLLEYIDRVMTKAHYEILKDDNSFYGEIQGFEGVYASASDLETCRNELKEILEEWILLRVSRNLEVPEIDGLTLKIVDVA